MTNTALQALEDAIFLIDSASEFEDVALKVFHFQRTYCSVYRQYLELLNRAEPKCVSEIPCIPIELFKRFELRSHLRKVEVEFRSSGTTGMDRSHHFVESTQMYERSFLPTYEQQIGLLSEQVIIALLPNYLEQGNSSLVYMVDYLMKQTLDPLSGYYLESLSDIKNAYDQALEKGKKVVIFGVSYALFDLAEKKMDLSQAIIIETGGMKGRRKELSKEELHEVLKNGLNVPYIASEYGMCELLSQGYSSQDGLFELPAWMKFYIREVNDPFNYISTNKTGGVNIIDLANLYSCSFISTQDLGKDVVGRLKLMGRFDHSDVRGCNLLVQ